VGDSSSGPTSRSGPTHHLNQSVLALNGWSSPFSDPATILQLIEVRADLFFDRDKLLIGFSVGEEIDSLIEPATELTIPFDDFPKLHEAHDIVATEDGAVPVWVCQELGSSFIRFAMVDATSVSNGEARTT
jgi:hypothetical protein